MVDAADAIASAQSSLAWPPTVTILFYRLTPPPTQILLTGSGDEWETELAAYGCLLTEFGNEPFETVWDHALPTMPSLAVMNAAGWVEAAPRPPAGPAVRVAPAPAPTGEPTPFNRRTVIGQATGDRRWPFGVSTLFAHPDPGEHSPPLDLLITIRARTAVQFRLAEICVTEALALVSPLARWGYLPLDDPGDADATCPHGWERL